MDVDSSSKVGYICRIQPGKVAATTKTIAQTSDVFRSAMNTVKQSMTTHNSNHQKLRPRELSDLDFEMIWIIWSATVTIF
ncbi:hypothetical protein ScPMuIL_004256 [Solemya velum]